MLDGMMPTRASPGVITPGQFGPISRQVPPSSPMYLTARAASSTGTPSVMQITSSMPAAAASTIASPANGGGTKMMLVLAPPCSTASATVS
jgi:hypothetical protein